MSSMNLENSYNLTKAAKYLEVSRVTFYKLIQRYKLKPAGKIGTMNLFDVKDLDKIKKKISSNV